MIAVITEEFYVFEYQLILFLHHCYIYLVIRIETDGFMMGNPISECLDSHQLIKYCSLPKSWCSFGKYLKQILTAKAEWLLGKQVCPKSE